MVIAPPAMFFPKPYSPRMVAGLAPLMAACLSSSASSQEYSPVIEDRVEAGLLQPPESGPESGRHDGWDIGLVISAAYDDNVFLSADKPESDMVFQVAPTIAYATGDRNEGEDRRDEAGHGFAHASLPRENANSAFVFIASFRSALVR